MNRFGINTEMVSALEYGNFQLFKDRLEPQLAGILSNGEPILINNENKKFKLSTFNQKLDLEGKNLTKFNLKNCELKYAKLSDCNLTKINLEKANLDFCNLKRSNLKGANLTQTSLIYTNLTSANIENLNLNFADLVHTIFSKKIVTKISDEEYEIDYEGSNITDITAIEAYLSGVEFRKCKIDSSNFSGSSIKNTLFDYTSLLKTNFSNSKFNNVIIKDTQKVFDTSFEKTNIKSINFINSIVSNCSFSNALIFDLELNNVIFDNCNFYKTNFINSDLSRNNARFENCNFYKSKFNRSSISFEESRFIECNFKDSIFDNCEIFIEDKEKPTKSMPKKIYVNKPGFEAISLLNERRIKLNKAISV